LTAVVSRGGRGAGGNDSVIDVSVIDVGIGDPVRTAGRRVSQVTHPDSAGVIRIEVPDLRTEPDGIVMTATGDGSFTSARTRSPSPVRHYPHPLGRRPLVTARRPVARVVIIGLLAIGCASGCSRAPSTLNATPAPSPTRPIPSSGGFRDSGVQVEARITASTATTGNLVVTLTPDPGFHVYSLDLPDRGISGLGRPTRVRTVNGLTATGRTAADRQLIQLRMPELDVVLPVYPEGPLQVTVPVKLIPGARREIAVSYAACSAQICRSPVADHPLELPAQPPPS
jgi:hypothetical protein